MKSKPEISGILFDFDGTLTRPGEIDFVEIKRRINCPPDSPILEFLALLPDADRCAAEAVLHEFEAESAATACPNSGAEQLLGLLHARGIPMGILTRNSRASIKAALANFTRTAPENFAVIITREDVDNIKPHPEGVFLAARHMAVQVEQIAMIGDYRFDIEAGTHAGAITFFLCNGDPPLTPPPADYVLRSLSDFQCLFEKEFLCCG